MNNNEFIKGNYVRPAKELNSCCVMEQFPHSEIIDDLI